MADERLQAQGLYELLCPEGLIGLSQRLYSWPSVQTAVPLNSHFLWLDLASPNIIAAVLVAASMYVLQKMSTMPSPDPRQDSMNRMTTLLMPLMFGFFALSFPSGLSLYWILFNVISIGIQYKVAGWGDFTMPSWPLGRKPAPAGAPADKGTEIVPSTAVEEKPAKPVARRRTKAAVSPEPKTEEAPAGQAVGENTVAEPAKEQGDK